MEPRFFNPWGNLRITRHNLPHWQQAGASIFVTFRLADSLPVKLLAELADERAAWLKARETPLSPADEAIYHRLFSTKLDAWLDAGHGDCLLRDAQAQAVLRETLEHFDGVRYQLIAWVIMPNHVHVCFLLYEGWSLERVMFTWKRRSAGELNRLTGRKGVVWQRDYFDRLVRDAEHFGKILRYIKGNPERAKLREGEFALWVRGDV